MPFLAQKDQMSAHILLAEDDDGLRTIVVDELLEAGFKVEAVADGAIAISSLETNVYDLVLLDNRMPNKSGIEVLEFMRSENIRSRVIMVTGVHDHALANQALKLGANEIITKPFALADLIRCINKVLAI
jgi:DNA-binding response OmpR family regulator